MSFIERQLVLQQILEQAILNVRLPLKNCEVLQKQV